VKASEDDDLAFAVRLAEEAGRVVMERYERLERVGTRARRTW
jgi:hypothetical protein